MSKIRFSQKLEARANLKGRVPSSRVASFSLSCSSSLINLQKAACCDSAIRTSRLDVQIDLVQDSRIAPSAGGWLHTGGKAEIGLFELVQDVPLGDIRHLDQAFSAWERDFHYSNQAGRPYARWVPMRTGYGISSGTMELVPSPLGGSSGVPETPLNQSFPFSLKEAL
ncbi:hypothetical protein CC78DRAFT_613835 [Lojkania enalia]|uniref:Uncharacterized protein n=1 Tax=Lojkania enalia TaxID=147567 RepID=A0A9P4N919_9PLEO|nr:hypothetical protein CC78DRAFT_613835 [Didymosphaeria enalia]